ncbi:MAG TPA: MFS transporter [Lacipirellulaceae bacterium]|nr:MFS transporter [Lacipirellulaceae bacterium]
MTFAGDMPDPAARRTERLILIALAAVQFTTIVDFMVVMPLGPQLMSALHIDPAKFGLVVASYAFAAGVSGLIASSVVDRFDRRAAFVVLYAGFLVGTLLCALAPNYLLLIAARVATGACGGVLGGMSMAIIGDVFPEHRRGRATSSLMSAFALASVAGVPLGLRLGAVYGWHTPFLALVIAGLPVLGLAAYALPPMSAHVGAVHARPLRTIIETFSVSNHLYAFALISLLMIGGFAVIPYITTYFVANLGMDERSEIPWMYVAGGVLTLIGSPIIGRLADRHGKLLVYRVIAPFSALMLVVISHLPAAHPAIAILAVGLLMVTNAGRMIAAMAMATSSVLPHRRGGFMSANSSMQHIASGLGSYIGGLIITQQTPASPIANYGLVGWFGCATTLLTLWIAGRVRSVEAGPADAEPLALDAAAEAAAPESLVGV